MDAPDIVSKLRVSASGQKSGGNPIARGALYTLLRNRLYLGEIRHTETFTRRRAVFADKTVSRGPRAAAMTCQAAEMSGQIR